MPFIDVNTDAVVSYAAKLGRLSRSAYPVAVGTTLNAAAFDVKKVTMPASSDVFTKRKPTFFKATSTVSKATGFDVKTMRAMVGFTGHSQAVEDLQQQEKGGDIGGRAFVPMDSARTGGSNRKSIRANARLTAIKNIADTKNVSGKNEGQRFIKSVIFAGKGGHVLAEYNGVKILWRVNSINKTEENHFKLTPLYTYQKSRDVNVSATGFMEEASEASAKKMEGYFIKAAKGRIEKALK